MKIPSKLFPDFNNSTYDMDLIHVCAGKNS